MAQASSLGHLARGLGIPLISRGSRRCLSDAPSRLRPWYDDGLNFECTKSLLSRGARRCLSDAPSRPRPWYDDGLNFECTKCGACCKLGDSRTIRVSERELREMAALLGRDLEDLRRERTTMPRQGRAAGDDARVVLRGKSNAKGERVCTFLSESNLCEVQNAKPTQCRTYPDWPELLASSFEWVAERRRCEGIGEDGGGGEEGVVPRERIRHDLVVEYLSRMPQDAAANADQESGMTYEESSSLLREVDPGLIEEFEDEFLEKNRRVLLEEYEDGARNQVVDFHGEGAAVCGQAMRAKRVVISKDSPWLSQSEMFVRSDGSLATDLLPQQIQQALALPFLFLRAGEDFCGRILVLGSGACAYSTVMSTHFPGLSADNVDLDATMFSAARTYFGATFGDAMSAHVGDAAAFIEDKVGAYDVVIVDICGAARGGEAAVPPEIFVEEGFLSAALDALAPRGGVVAVHLAERNAGDIGRRVEEISQKVWKLCPDVGVSSLVLSERAAGSVSCALFLSKCPDHLSFDGDGFALEKAVRAHSILGRGVLEGVVDLVREDPSRFQVS